MKGLNLTAKYQIDGAARAISMASSDIRVIGLESTRFQSTEERAAYIADQVGVINKALAVLCDGVTEL